MSDTLALGQVHCGDIRDLAPRIAPGSVNCIACSPPYMGLRDYGTARWEGGDAACDHVDDRQRRAFGPSNTLGPTGHLPETNAAGVAGVRQYRDRCGKCGAVRVDRQLGLEPTVQEFVANLVAVFRALRPALRDDGTLWVNLGDSYANDAKWGGQTGGKHAAGLHGEDGPGRGRTTSGLPPKCLTLAPARFAIAMCEDGWILRSVIRWCKKAAMPESVTDRPTSAVEEIYLFVKQPRYWYDALAVAEPAMRGYAGSTFTEGKTGHNGLGRVSQLPREEAAIRNARNYMVLGPEPFPGDHYAVMPSAIPRFAVRAGCPPRVCAWCGSPWVRLVERALTGVNEARPWNGMPGRTGNGLTRRRAGDPSGTTLGWRATCACGPDAGTRPGVVLDPFMGSGTTALVAVQENRDWIGVDLDGRSVGWTAERLAGAQRRLPLDLAGEAAGG